MSEGNKPIVLIVHNHYQIPGGEDTVVANEKKLLENHGHKVILYTRDNKELKTMGKMRKLFLPFTTIYNPRTSREVKRIIKDQKIDIVHVHNTLNLISPSVYYASRKCGVPVVQTIHNFRFLCPSAIFYRDGHICEDCVSKGLTCAIKHSCYRGSKVQTIICVISTKLHRLTGIYKKINYITLTEFNKSKLLLLKQIKEERVFVKPNFSFSKNEKQIKKEVKDYYLYIGRIEEIKGVDILLNAFSKMPEKKLYLAGEGPLFIEKKKWAENYQNISFLGFLDKENIYKYISGAKAVILPSQVYEGFPMTITEAFSLSTPMIVSNIGNTGSLVEDGITGIKFQYNSEDALIEAVDRIESLDIISMGKKAYEKYVSEYSSEENYKKLMQIYNLVMKG